MARKDSKPEAIAPQGCVDPYIRSALLLNFKKFAKKPVDLDPRLTILIGDNEAGKSTILLGVDLAISGSRSKVEAIGIESLLRKGAVQEFNESGRKIEALPRVAVELYLGGLDSPDLHGRANARGESTFGLRMSCEPSEDYQSEIAQLLESSESAFPFEFYVVKFHTFGGYPYSGFRKYLRHVHIDSASINAEYAQREYTRALFHVHAPTNVRGSLESKYRMVKEGFTSENLDSLVEAGSKTRFQVRSSSKSNLETDLLITEEGISLEHRGRGRQALVKTDFAMSRGKGSDTIDLVLLEEPENHLSHAGMRKLVNSIAGQSAKQVIVATHSSVIASRLDLRNARLLDSKGNIASLATLSPETADFFCKAPSNNFLAFAMSSRVILVEGDAEYMLISTLYEIWANSTLDADRVQVISVGGTSFKRYMEVAQALSIRVAVVRDNDGDYQRYCVDNYEDFVAPHIRVFADRDPDRKTFEVCMYLDNISACEAAFEKKTKTLSVQQHMLANKAESALKLAKEYGPLLNVPSYIREAIEWIRG